MTNTVLLGDYVKIRTGKLDANASSANGQYPFFTCSRMPLKIDKYSYDCECVLVAGNCDINAKYYNGKFDAYQRTYIIESLDNLKLDVKFLYYFLEKYIYRLRELSIGGVIKYIKLEHLTMAEIPIPAFTEQQKIVAILDKLCKQMVGRKEQLAKLDDLIKSQFIKMFGDPVVNSMGWKTDNLSVLITKANNGMSRRGNDADGNIVLRLVELQDGHINYTCPNKICLSDAEKERYLLAENDFLFARVNGNPDYVGRCAVFHTLNEPVFHNDHIIRVHFDEMVIEGTFASTLLNSTYGKRQIRVQIKTSAGQYTISQEGIGAIKAILPPIELQNQFAAFVKQVNKSKNSIQQSLEKLETCYKALMQEYFE